VISEVNIGKELINSRRP